MKSKFRGYYRPSDTEFNNLWKQCIFTFDTNVLQDLYRFSSETADDIFKVLGKLSSSLWMSHQVAMEYHRGRLGVIRETTVLLMIIFVFIGIKEMDFTGYYSYHKYLGLYFITP